MYIELFKDYGYCGAMEWQNIRFYDPLYLNGWYKDGSEVVNPEDRSMRVPISLSMRNFRCWKTIEWIGGTEELEKRSGELPNWWWDISEPHPKQYKLLQQPEEVWIKALKLEVNLPVIDLETKHKQRVKRYKDRLKREAKYGKTKRMREARKRRFQKFVAKKTGIGKDEEKIN